MQLPAENLQLWGPKPLRLAHSFFFVGLNTGLGAANKAEKMPGFLKEYEELGAASSVELHHLSASAWPALTQFILSLLQATAERTSSLLL